mgnify:CR=1 FL=1
MLSQIEFEKIKKELDEFFGKLSFATRIELLELENEIIKIKINTEEPQLLIGEKGETLLEIQHLLKLILKKKFFIKEQFYIDLDVNDYKKKKINYLKELANNIADEVSLTKREKELPPMSSYERRIIHLELAQRGDVVSESIGKEPERRVVVKPLL